MAFFEMCEARSSTLKEGYCPEIEVSRLVTKARVDGLLFRFC
ncbi:unnamed protein product [Camellia sinensis]